MRRVILKSSMFRHDLLRPKTQVKKMYWDFHKGDSDYNPTVPHGHSLDGKYKLELWSGKIYDVSSGKVHGIAKSKEMKILYAYPGFREFVEECREEYRRIYPAVKLPPLTPCNGFITAQTKKSVRPLKKRDRLIFRININKF